jgi:hypothetical protein
VRRTQGGCRAQAGEIGGVQGRRGGGGRWSGWGGSWGRAAAGEVYLGGGSVVRGARGRKGGRGMRRWDVGRGRGELGDGIKIGRRKVS